MTTLEDQFDLLLQDNNSKTSISPDKPKSSTFDLNDDDSNGPILTHKKRIHAFSDSDSDTPRGISKFLLSDESGSEQKSENEEGNNTLTSSGAKISRLRKPVSSDSDSDSNEKKTTKEQSDAEVNSDNRDSENVVKNVKKTTRLRKVSSDESDSESSSKNQQIANKYEEQQMRIKNKKNKLKDKFKNLLSSREKGTEIKKDDSEKGSRKENSDESDNASDDASSIDKIKQKIKERTSTLKMTICDPDTSDEESQRTIVSKPKKVQKRTKLISPKKQRMSAKEAMENMQKIKSESNRMLREKEVTLPYHRPKALSLQDIMKRRKPAVSADGKALPIKMNEEQLKQYAFLLEQRQKEIMELCKSESEEEEESTENNISEATPVEKPSEDVDHTDKDTLVSSIPNNNLQTDEITAQIEPIPDVINSGDINSKVNLSNHEDLSENNTETPMVTESTQEDDFQDKSEDVSAEMHLVYNDSIEENPVSNILKESVESGENLENEKEVLIDNSEIAKDIDLEEKEPIKNTDRLLENMSHTEVDSQLISLHYGSENTEHPLINSEAECVVTGDITNKDCADTKANSIDEQEDDNFPDDDFPDDDMDINDVDMENIDSIIENAEITKNIDTTDAINSPGLVNIPVLNVKPKLTGAPGVIIDLDGSDPIAPKKLSGVELLKERFTFFAKLKTPEELEREREQRIKPGNLHLKLKQQLEDEIAEQRSLEWSKRLESEKQQQMEMDAIRGDTSDVEDDLEKIEKKLEEHEAAEESSAESEEELLEDDVFIEDKPRKKNPLLDNEAEESDVEETEDNNKVDKDLVNDDEEMNDGVEGDNEDDEEDDSSQEEESSESEEENDSKPKKGRILKAFEDSDDDETSKMEEKRTPTVNNADNTDTASTQTFSQSENYGIMDSQDDVIQLAQVPKQLSSDVFTSQGSALNTQNTPKDDDDLGTQTFSILDGSKTVKHTNDPDELVTISEDSDKIPVLPEDLDKLAVISDTQPFNDDLDAVVGMCSGSFQTQNCIEFQPPSTQSQISQSQAIGDDVLDMCTGKFYDNQFVSPSDDKLNTSDDLSQSSAPPAKLCEDNQKTQEVTTTEEKAKQKQDGDILKSVLDELNDLEEEVQKPLKFFNDGKKQNKENEPNLTNTQVKKRFVIDSDEESKDNVDNPQKKKKLKKKKLEQRALQISDDEDDSEDAMEEDEYLSGIESENENGEERLVEYDSEENEVVIQPQVTKKKKRKATEFFEQEAELTSEDEWAGSGDEDEAGLDRMEREAGDDDTFHEGQLQRELGQIHMRDVLDQDKREVRLIQELLFEDGDLGGGGRQRKFRWRNADGEEVTGTVPEEFADTQEEEFESEEQWRKQRHEREMFLKQMKNDDNEDLNVSVNRTTIIKANLTSRTMSSLLEEVNQTKGEEKTVVEKKTAKDIPSPAKKPFSVFQQSYHGSLLTRGQGALARLAALATPLAADDDARPLLQPSNKRNFVFAALTPDEKEPKVTKRKAENVGTPRLVKKMKTEEKQNRSKSSLLEFLKT